MDLALVVCTSCDTLNRVPAGRLGDKPKCGQCKRPLFDGRPAAVSGAQFRRQIEGSSVPVLVEFWAPWCGPCKAMGPSFERAAATLEPRFRLLEVDIDRAPDAADALAIRSVPTMILFQGGKERGRTAGAMDAAQIARWAEQTARTVAA